MADRKRRDDRLTELQGAMLAFETVFGQVVASLGAGETIDRRVFNETIIDRIADHLRETRGGLVDAQSQKTFDAALRLLEDMRAGAAGTAPFTVIRGGRSD